MKSWRPKPWPLNFALFASEANLSELVGIVYLLLIGALNVALGGYILKYLAKGWTPMFRRPQLSLTDFNNKKLDEYSQEKPLICDRCKKPFYPVRECKCTQEERDYWYPPGSKRSPIGEVIWDFINQKP